MILMLRALDGSEESARGPGFFAVRGSGWPLQLRAVRVSLKQARCIIQLNGGPARLLVFRAKYGAAAIHLSYGCAYDCDRIHEAPAKCAPASLLCRAVPLDWRPPSLAVFREFARSA